MWRQSFLWCFPEGLGNQCLKECKCKGKAHVAQFLSWPTLRPLPPSSYHDQRIEPCTASNFNCHQMYCSTCVFMLTNVSSLCSWIEGVHISSERTHFQLCTTIVCSGKKNRLARIVENAIYDTGVRSSSHVISSFWSEISDVHGNCSTSTTEPGLMCWWPDVQIPKYFTKVF